jgi:ribosomal protein S18 acetylase RimI-like enzyme
MKHKPPQKATKLSEEQYRIRLLRRNELDRFVELGYPTCAFLHGRTGMSELLQKQRFRSFVSRHAFEEGSEIHVLADESDRIIGQLWLHTSHNQFNGQKELWIWDLTIDKPYQGTGLSKGLLEFAQHRSVELGCQELWLLVAEDNVRAREVYQTFGLADGARLMKLTLGAQKKSAATAPGDLIVRGLESITVRTLKEKHIVPMLELWREAELEHKPRGRDTAQKLQDELRRAPDLFWGAFDADRIVGSVFGTLEGRRKGWLNRLAVHPDYRRKGIARALIAKCEESLSKRGARIIAVFTLEENEASARLLESCGYAHSPGLRYYTKREHDDI